MTNKWYVIHLNFLDIPMCHLSFYSSKLQIYPRWLCLQCWNIFLLPAGKMVSFISREPWRDPGRETAVGFCASSLLAGSIMLCGQGMWYLSMVPPSEAQKVISQFPNAAPLWTSLPSSGLQKCTFQGGPGPSLTEQRTLSTLLVSWVICVTSSRILFSSYLLL